MSFETNTALHEIDSDAAEQLDLLRAALARNTYEGYPEQADRLVLSPDQFVYDEAGRLVLHPPFSITREGL